MTQWNSLFCLPDPSNTLIDCLQQTLVRLEYTLYDAFDLIPGKAYSDTFKTFIAPNSGQWMQILMDDEDVDDLELLAKPLSEYGLCLLAHFDQTDATLKLYQGGIEIDIADGLANYLLNDKSPDDLTRALEGKTPLPIMEIQLDEKSQLLAIKDLPREMQKMSKGVNLLKAKKMFHGFVDNFMGKSDAQGAKDMLNPEPLDWNNAGGMRIRGLMSCLMAGDAWLSPDFATVRDAYQRHIRLQHRPNAKLYPGDKQMMDAVPKALSYTPVYGGRD